MIITGVDIRKMYNGPSALKAIVSISLDGELAVHDIKIINGPRRFIQMPSDRRDEEDMLPGWPETSALKSVPPRDSQVKYNPREELRSVVHPIRRDFRSYLEEIILHVYDLALEDYGKMTADDLLYWSTKGIRSAKHLDTRQDTLLAGIPVSYKIPWRRPYEPHTSKVLENTTAETATEVEISTEVEATLDKESKDKESTAEGTTADDTMVGETMTGESASVAAEPGTGLE